MNSLELFNESKKYISGGVNSPVRAFGNVGGTPFFTDRVDGARIFTCDGRSLVDYGGRLFSATTIRRYAPR